MPAANTTAATPAATDETHVAAVDVEKAEAAATGATIGVETADAATALLLNLAAMDLAAKAQGHSLVEVLVTAAKNAFGIDIRPAPAVAVDVD
jgi:hypothetical protein